MLTEIEVTEHQQLPKLPLGHDYWNSLTNSGANNLQYVWRYLVQNKTVAKLNQQIFRTKFEVELVRRRLTELVYGIILAHIIYGPIDLVSRANDRRGNRAKSSTD